ncbi:MAG: hypothetical protein RLN67_02100 [Algiphilus sp.]|uniref:hypothetical protein n=1 Tax=Algiphilus sp. TaxID=1872431 RepID=UPI0032EBC709
MSYHIVAIDPHRYYRLHSFEAASLEEAAHVALRREYRRVSINGVIAEFYGERDVGSKWKRAA